MIQNKQAEYFKGKRIIFMLFSFLSFLLFSCTESKIQSNSTPKEDPIEVVKERMQAFSEKDYTKLGELLYTIDFKVKTDNINDFEDGYIPWADLEKPEQDLPKLYGKDEIVIKDTSITIIIDYPLTVPYKFNLTSKKGFTRGQLLTEISKHYYLLYQEEENTATIKTIPPNERTTMYNINETNGKYDIWGHDIADLDMSQIMIYKTETGEIVLVPGIES